MHEFSEAQKLIQFLSGLNETYSTVKSNILMMSLVPSVEKAYSILIRDEKQMKINSSSQPFSSDSTSFIANSNSNSGPNQPNTTRNFTQRVNFEPRRTTLTYKYCKKPGHTVDKCYKLYGFPQDFRFTKGKRVAACVQIESTNQTSPKPDSSQTEDIPHGFSKEQYAHLMSLFHQMQMSSPNQQSTSQDYPIYANIVGWHDNPGPSPKRPFKIGKVEHGLYIMRLSSHGIAAVDPSQANACPISSFPKSDSIPIFSVHDSVVDSSNVVPVACNSSSINKNDVLWHKRMGHIPFVKIVSIPHLSGKFSSRQSFTCTICPMARQQRLPFPESSIHSDRPFQLVHIDLCGLYHTATYNEFRYFLTIVDDYSRVTWTHLLSCKGNAFSIIKSFIAMVCTQFYASIETIRTDNAFELGSAHSHASYLTSLGISHQISCPHTPQQNGIVERKHTHLLETARALLFQSKLPAKYWEECVLTATYLINILPSTILSNKTPYEVLLDHPPKYGHLRSFGCLAYATFPHPSRDKLDITFVEHIFPSTFTPSGFFPSSTSSFFDHITPNTIPTFTSSPFPSSDPATTSSDPFHTSDHATSPSSPFHSFVSSPEPGSVPSPNITHNT
uniref:Integrase catalytic domain-containing protein n=1 Tax=Nicotiana tabacum TaxID=4097 RepID=A0A1S3YX21_TOBAC|nr:PREDICTED: uncharacterized protein LOC107780652 [Nicotiana tabacum]